MKKQTRTRLCGVILILALATSAQAQETERSIEVEPGVRLEISNHAGEVIIRGWDRDEIQILAEHGSRDGIEIDQENQLIHLRGWSQHGRPAIIDYQIRAPKWMDVEIGGPYCDIEVQDMEGQLHLETVEGEIRVRGGMGHVSMRSVEGDLFLEGATGRIEMASIDGDVTLRGITGAVRAETVDGELVLVDVHSSDIEASTFDGDITFEASIAPEC